MLNVLPVRLTGFDLLIGSRLGAWALLRSSCTVRRHLAVGASLCTRAVMTKSLVRRTPGVVKLLDRNAEPRSA